MKILHSADLHLDTAFVGRTPEQAARLRQALLRIPGQLAELCRERRCDMLLLSGDVFDGPWSTDSLDVLRSALREAAVPVFIAPGNHDFCGPDSPWLSESWPENVHVFTHPVLESVVLPQLGCRVYGAGFASMDSAALLEGFHADGPERWQIGVLHGDPLQRGSPCNPVTQAQIAASALSYLALGHIHKTGTITVGDTCCAWPGCPMGRGFDELGEKGVLLVTLEDTVSTEFIPLDTPRFYDLEAPVRTDAADTLSALLPAAGSGDYYRITLTGETEPPDLDALQAQFAHFPNLLLRDRTVPVKELWACAGEDSLEGTYFAILRDAMEEADGKQKELITLAARISRRILDGREVELP